MPKFHRNLLPFLCYTSQIECSYYLLLGGFTAHCECRYCSFFEYNEVVQIWFQYVGALERSQVHGPPQHIPRALTAFPSSIFQYYSFQASSHKDNNDKHFINFSRNLGWLGKPEEMEGNMAVDREVKRCTQSSHRPWEVLTDFSIGATFYKDNDFSGPVKIRFFLTFEI